MTVALVRSVQDKSTACGRATLTGSAVLDRGRYRNRGCSRNRDSVDIRQFATGINSKPIAISIATPIPIATPTNSGKSPALRGGQSHGFQPWLITNKAFQT